MGTENPADMMAKHLPRASLDKCINHLHQVREEGRAKASLDIQGKEKKLAENSA